MSLADIIRQRKQTSGPAPVSSETVARQQQTAATGKVGRSTGGPGMTSMGSQLAATAGAADRAAIDTQGLMQTQALESQEKAQDKQFGLAKAGQKQQLETQTQNMMAQQQIFNERIAAQEEMAIKQMTQQEQLQSKQMTEAYANAMRDLTSERKITEQQIFQYALQERSSLGADKYMAGLDQTSHVLAMADQKYSDEIRRIGALNGLEEDIEFKMESQKLAFGQDFDLLGQQFNMQALANADEREFQTAMAEMNMDTAIALADQAAKEQAYKSILTGVTTAASAYATYGSETPTASTDTRTGSEVLQDSEYRFNPNLS